MEAIPSSRALAPYDLGKQSSVAGIVDSQGGLRIVVTQTWHMLHHVGKGERLFVVPGLLVWEPVQFSHWAWIVHVATRYTNSQLRKNPNRCGDCNFCCRVEPIPVLKKPPHKTCAHYCKGCQIYDSRPDVCREFKCLWRRSQDEDDTPMALNLRPDFSGVMLVHDTEGEVEQKPDHDLIEVHLDPRHPSGLDHGHMPHWLAQQVRLGKKLKWITHYV